MGRYGPPVYTEDRSGELLAQALTSAAQNFIGMHRQKNQDRIAADERTRQHGREDVTDAVTLDQAGYGRGTAPGDDLANALPSGGFVERHQTSGAPFDEHLPFDPSGLADAMRGPVPQSSLTSPASRQQPQQSQPAAAPHPGAFNPITGTFGTPAPAQSSQRYQQVTPGLYRDETRTPEARHLTEFQHQHELEQVLAAQDRAGAAGDYTKAGVDPGRAILYARNPALAENDPAIGKRISPDKWQTVQGEDGFYQVNPETGEVRAMTSPTGRPLRPKQPQAQFSFTTGTDAEGHPIIVAGNTRTGTVTPTPIGKPVSSQGGAQQSKNKALLDLMTQAYPTMARLASKVRPYAITAAVNHPNIGNTLLNQDEQNYLSAARNYLAGILHVESGARLSKDQLNFGLQRYFPTMGDTPETVQTKLAAARRTMEDRQREFGEHESSAPHSSPRTGGESGDIDLSRTGGTPKPGGNKVTVNGKTFILPD